MRNSGSANIAALIGEPRYPIPRSADHGCGFPILRGVRNHSETLRGLRQLTIEEHYWTVRDTLRELGHRDSLYVIWAYCQSLQVNGFNIPNDIQVDNAFLNAAPRPQTILAEWTLELMAREVIRYADEVPRRGRTLRQWATVAKIANALRDLDGEIYAQHCGRERIHLECMRISHRQFVWQQHRFNWEPIIRYYKLFNRPDILAYMLSPLNFRTRAPQPL